MVHVRNQIFPWSALFPRLSLSGVITSSISTNAFAGGIPDFQVRYAARMRISAMADILSRAMMVFIHLNMKSIGGLYMIVYHAMLCS